MDQVLDEVKAIRRRSGRYVACVYRNLGEPVGFVVEEALLLLHFEFLLTVVDDADQSADFPDETQCSLHYCGRGSGRELEESIDRIGECHLQCDRSAVAHESLDLLLLAVGHVVDEENRILERRGVELALLLGLLRQFDLLFRLDLRHFLQHFDHRENNRHLQVLLRLLRRQYRLIDC
ncbi:hypothetical protein PMAYCL1PPCAC_31115 [Pristionchus mayeri]|uniref:Uncharacterized protein n=1 Tax=Pristionchus mayeri TaxID=1317129 RepID=A0AAN5DDY5_9BILA|nr:hypothetical protein PMAYCL1PPCAC_31115 [Pristionchus mayeri]